MGVHPDTVTDYARSDMPVITRGGQGKLSEYDAIECLAWQRQKMGRNALENAKTRATENQAQLSEIKIKVALGQYLDRDEVDADVGRIVGVIRAQLLNLPRLAVQSGRIDRDQEAGVKEVVREVLTTLSQWVDDRATTEPPADALLLGETLEEES